MIPHFSKKVFHVLSNIQGRDARERSEIPTLPRSCQTIPPVRVVLPRTNNHLPRMNTSTSLLIVNVDSSSVRISTMPFTLERGWLMPLAHLLLLYLSRLGMRIRSSLLYYRRLKIIPSKFKRIVNCFP